MSIICGIDEAGRGPLIGPLVICGTSIDKSQEKKLIELGVKDSKLLTPKQRVGMFERIKEIVKEHMIIVVPPQEIDEAVFSKTMNLNWLEAIRSAMIINKLKPDIAYVDCPSNNTQAYADYVKNLLLDKNIKLIAEHKADQTYPVVSAASILAKVTRDREIEKIQERIKEPLGSGYPADPLTQAFLKNNYHKCPDIFRKSWSSYQKVADGKKQKVLGEY
ncbi:ribonuclease HII [Candidatus Woesearchaeota archaeon]|nr:ribonuclease HII [Candidatus Woesearchaeota archaeon]